MELVRDPLGEDKGPVRPLHVPFDPDPGKLALELVPVTIRVDFCTLDAKDFMD